MADLQPSRLESFFRERHEEDPESDYDSDEVQRNIETVIHTIELPKTDVKPYDQSLFQLLEPLGADPLFLTCLAHDILLQRNVVLKIVRKSRLRTIDEETVLRSDVTRLSKLLHANILPIIRMGRWNRTQPYLVLPAVNHLSLDRWIAEEPDLNLATLLTIFGQVCDACSYAHSQNVVHRHLRPEKIYLDVAGKVAVSEFGLFYDGRYQGDVIESLSYDLEFGSPETIRNMPALIDFRADIFSLGKLLGWLMESTKLESKPRLALTSVVRKCTRRARSNRYQSVGEVQAAIFDALSGLTSQSSASR